MEAAQFKCLLQILSDSPLVKKKSDMFDLCKRQYLQGFSGTNMIICILVVTGYNRLDMCHTSVDRLGSTTYSSSIFRFVPESQQTFILDTDVF